MSEALAFQPRPDSKKEEVLTKAHASRLQDISDAVVVKKENVFFVTLKDGSLPMRDHGLGLFYHDCCYLDGYVLTISEQEPFPLAVTSKQGFVAIFQLTNPDIPNVGEGNLPKKNLEIRWTRSLESDPPCLIDTLRIENFHSEEVDFSIALNFRARFRDVFNARDLTHDQPGKLHDPKWEGKRLVFSYDGADDIFRSTHIEFSRAPDFIEGTTARFTFKLSQRGHAELHTAIHIHESSKSEKPRLVTRPNGQTAEAVQTKSRKHRIQGLSEYVEVRSDSLTLNLLMDRSIKDLYTLRSSIEGYEYFSAGLPWFGTLFGRDSAIIGLQLMAVNPMVSEEIIRVLAHFQGKRFDPWRDEKPGQILHEMRVGELANIGLVPHSPYYGTVDATPLYLILMSRYCTSVGSLDLFLELQDSAEAALRWIDDFADQDRNGYIEYYSPLSPNGLINQGWKDSGNAIVDGSGSSAKPPIALVEVQAYVYLAKRSLAAIYRRLGDLSRSQQLESQAHDLKLRFNRDFWVKRKNFFAMAISKGKNIIDVISSNPGHAL
jgi:glycogen debranching enzyme